MFRFIRLVGFLLAFVSLTGFTPPRNAEVYRNAIVRETRYFWGMNQNPSLFFGQIHQESAYNPDARSSFASGLTQFTPDTAKWIQQLYANQLSEFCSDVGGCPLNPRWAIRSMLIYDKRLWDQFRESFGDERYAFMLSSYNGGLGWARREQKKALEYEYDPNVWFGVVETVCLRAQWACRENRDYPQKILFKWRPLYESWL